MDKHLLQYKGSKQVMVLVGLLTIAQSVAIIIQAIYLAKAITQLFNGNVWTVALPSFAFFVVAHIVRHPRLRLYDGCDVRGNLRGDLPSSHQLHNLMI